MYICSSASLPCVFAVCVFFSHHTLFHTHLVCHRLDFHYMNYVNWQRLTVSCVKPSQPDQTFAGTIEWNVGCNLWTCGNVSESSMCRLVWASEFMLSDADSGNHFISCTATVYEPSQLMSGVARWSVSLNIFVSFSVNWSNKKCTEIQHW